MFDVAQSTASVHELEVQTLRSAMGRFGTGVTIVTCLDAAGAPVGLTCNSFSSLSLDPPLVLWSLRSVSPSLPAFEAASHFAVNVLTQSQLELARRFAAPMADRFQHGAWSRGLGGAPVLAGCAAVFECDRQLHQRAGDHVLFIGRVRRVTDREEQPLLFQGGQYRTQGQAL